MKLTLNWLHDHIDTDLSAETIGAKLTMAGLELDGLTRLDQGMEQVMVGILMDVKPHPNADRLTLCQVRILDETLTLVCGAKNHAQGDKVAVARLGAKLPNGLTITETQIRGITSQGMLCSKQELGLATTSEGILILPPQTPEGTPIASVLGLDDVVFELGITPNRGDCLGVRGIARELGAITSTPLKPLPPITTEATHTTKAEIHIEDTTGCPRYAGRIIKNIQVAPSPQWLQKRLESVGLRAINNVVDITNFILLDLNQPLHAFDLARLQLPMVVRRAKDGESLRTLDGVERVLTQQMTVIADQQQALALAGIMGGETSGVEATTTDIFLEVAYFDPIATARTGRRLEIVSDSRHRFERGVDPEAITQVMERATQMIIELAGGHAGPITLQDAGTWYPPAPIEYRPQRINQSGSIQLSVEAMNGLLQGIGCHITPIDPEGQRFLALPPSWRHDLRLEEDLLEEVIRLYGYDRIPASLPYVPAEPPKPNLMHHLINHTRELLIGLGYLETINYAFVSAAIQGRFNKTLRPLALLNPLSEDQAVLRTELTAGLIETVQRNVNRGTSRLRLFEVGRVFLTDGQGGVTEQETMAAILTGSADEPTLHAPSRPIDFYDLKGDVEAILTDLLGDGVIFLPGGPEFLHPAKKAEISTKQGQLLGWMGAIHPTEQEALDLRKELYVVELNLTACSTIKKLTTKNSTAISRYPAIQSDFTFLLTEKSPAQSVIDLLLQIDATRIKQVTVTALYTGEGVPSGEKSLTVSLMLQADDRTLTDQDSKEITDKVIATMQERFKATLR